MNAKNKGEVIVVVGGQWGSESKGEVVAQICRDRSAVACVRTGAINAGHTVYFEGKPYKMQQIPVGWVNPTTLLVIGAGAYVSKEILEREIAMINEAMPGADVRNRLYIDWRAGSHLQKHHEEEAGMHERMGSTAEGCMAAAVDKMKRRSDYQPFVDIATATGARPVSSVYGHFEDTEALLNGLYDDGGTIVVEGTQGTLLDLHLGVEYPYCTSRQTHASAWLAEAGLAPTLNVKVVMVVRSHPIRVAGNSGPFPGEISWVSFAQEVNSKLAYEGLKPVVDPAAIDLFRIAEIDAARKLQIPSKSPELYTTEERAKYSTELSQLHKATLEMLGEETVKELKKFFEMTTVTKKLRRIAKLDRATLVKAARINRPTGIALTFLNYEFPELWGAKTWDEIMNRPGSDEYRKYLASISRDTGAPVVMLNTSATTMINVPENGYEW